MHGHIASIARCMVSVPPRDSRFVTGTVDSYILVTSMDPEVTGGPYSARDSSAGEYRTLDSTQKDVAQHEVKDTPLDHTTIHINKVNTSILKISRCISLLKEWRYSPHQTS